MSSQPEPTGNAAEAAPLSSLAIRCEYSKGKQCAADAVWAIRTHAAPQHRTQCPRVMLVCDDHLAHARHQYSAIAASFAGPHRHFCFNCNQQISDFDSLLWGVERIAP